MNVLGIVDIRIYQYTFPLPRYYPLKMDYYPGGGESFRITHVPFNGYFSACNGGGKL